MKAMIRNVVRHLIPASLDSSSGAAKKPGDVGSDFDGYVKRWRREKYAMEVGGDGEGLVTDKSSDQVKYPGDEWGSQDDLVTIYSELFKQYLPGDEPVSFLEIGAGGGRSTEVVLDLIGDRIGDYYVLDVSEEFAKVLQERIDRKLNIVIIDDVDLSKLPRKAFDFCLAQSSWSHISAYDQYRYLRELRGVMKYDAPVCVIGQFLLGVCNDWTFNRFKRRIYQAELNISGVYHEFTSLSMLAEWLHRLEYETDVVFNSGFIARSKQANQEHVLSELEHPIAVPYVNGLLGFLQGVKPENYRLPHAAIADKPRHFAG